MLHLGRRKLPRLEKLKRFKVHPAFIIAGVLALITGRFTDFTVCTLSALIHECAHALCGARMGYALDKIVLMPYGAVVKGDISGITFKDEVILCLSGPLVNLLIALLTAALWWLFPAVYPYTESVYDMNLSLFFTNMLPAYPLDAGRILMRAISEKFSDKAARRVCFSVSIITAAAGVGIFVFSCFSSPNFSALLFAAMLASGVFSTEKGEYAKIRFSYLKSFTRGVEIKRIALSENTALKTVIKFFSEDKYLIADIYSLNGEYVLSLRQEDLARLIEEKSIYSKFSDFLSDFGNIPLAKSKI